MDYDSWNVDGWDFKSLLPFAKKLETYHHDDPSVNNDVHGYDGPIHISKGTYCPEGPQDDLFAAHESLGGKQTPDSQDFRSVGGFSRWLRYVDLDGKRQDAAHRYIHPLMCSGNYPNLHLLLETSVTRVVFQGKRAVGIEYAPSARFEPGTGSSKTAKTITARKLVIISAGTLSSPSILERSGVGSRTLLGKLGIPVVSDLPGVGEQYQDHHLLTYPYKTSLKPEDTLDALWSGRVNFETALRNSDPRLGWNGIDMFAKIRPSPEEVAQLGPEFEELWNRDFKEQEGKPLLLLGLLSAFLGDYETLSDEERASQFATMGTITAYPYSRGSIHIVSRDINTPASFRTGFLSHPADLKVQVWAYKKQREIYRRTNAYAGELAIGHPKFKANSKAALCNAHPAKSGYESLEQRRNLPPLEYSAEDDAVIEEWIRSNLNSTWHSMGTCKMAPRDRGGVVDKNLNVYGTESLKVVGKLV